MNRRDFYKKAFKFTAFGAAIYSKLGVAAQWPDKPIKIILSHPPGSGPDNVARVLFEGVSKKTGYNFILENHPGGQNVIGAQYAARSEPDGYNFYFGTPAALIANPLLIKKLSYNPQNDFVGVAFIARSPFAILVNTNSRLQSIQDLIAESKIANGKFSLGNEGPRTFTGMISRLFNARSKANANLVSYNSIMIGVQDLLGNQIDALVADLASTAQFARQNKLRVLATASITRSKGWENIPSLAETLPGFDMTGWFSLVAPKGLSQEVMDQMNQQINLTLKENEIIERIGLIGPIVDSSMSANQVNAFLKNEYQRWSSITSEIGLLPE
jgi:tripartite-type tricarboxylate transporter receptor subunit TctC